MIKKISYERRVYESVDDNSLSKAISQKTDEKNKSRNKGLIFCSFSFEKKHILIEAYFIYLEYYTSRKYVILLIISISVTELAKLSSWQITNR